MGLKNVLDEAEECENGLNSDFPVSAETLFIWKMIPANDDLIHLFSLTWGSQQMDLSDDLLAQVVEVWCCSKQ